MTVDNIPMSRLRRVKTKAYAEFKQFLVIFVYLWVVFGLLSIHKSIVLSEHNLDYPEQTFAIINAFIFAKVLLVGEHFGLGTKFGHKPLIYPILHKSFIFTLVIICSHVIESVLVGLWHGNTVTNSFPTMGDGRVKGILSVGAVGFVVLLPFFAFREVGRVIGHKELWSLILEPRQSNPRLTSSVP
jgi:hypothetical protein